MDQDIDSFQLVSSSTVETINIERYDDKTRFMELQIVRYLVKAMRTNRKDKHSPLGATRFEKSVKTHGPAHTDSF